MLHGPATVLDRLALVATLIKAVVLGVTASMLTVAPAWMKPLLLLCGSLALAACVVAVSKS